MGDKTYIWLTVGISLLVFTSTARTQDEQWLQYHSEREALQIIGDMTRSNLKLTSERPQGIQLPDFKCKKPFFTSWPTPMVDSGIIWIAMDRTGEKGRWDQLYIDSNVNGHLNDETPVTAYRTEQYYTYFGPVKIVFEGEDGPLTYHLNFMFYENGETRRLYVSPGGWYEGDITVAGAKKHCMLIDYNGNGTFNDKSLNYSECDRIRIGKKGTRDTGYVGNYIEIDDTLYRTEIARDGAYIKLVKAEDVKLGTVRLPETITEFSAGGENGLFTFKPENAAASLPVGKYRINSWKIERKDEKGKKWELQGRSYSEKGDFEISEGTEISLEIGEPVTGNLLVSLNAETENYEFEKSVRGRLGEYVNLTSSGQSVSNLWKMHAKNKEGTFEKTYPMPDQ
ncbi:MAG: hypothetical protein ACETWQ_21320 [Phycisphaerae bacterium]